MAFPLLVNAYSVMVIGVGFFTVTDVRLEHPEKAYSPMLVTPLPMVAEVSLEQLRKALFPMLVTLLGISMEVRL